MYKSDELLMIYIWSTLDKDLIYVKLKIMQY